MQVGFCVRENIRKCERIPILRADDIRPYTDNRTGMVPTTQYHAKLRIGDFGEAVVEHSNLLIQLSRRFALSLNDRRGSFGDEVLV